MANDVNENVSSIILTNDDDRKENVASIIMTNDEEEDGNKIDPLATPPMTLSGGGNGGNAGITKQVPPPPPLMPSGGGNGSGTNDLLPPLMPPPGGENLPVLPVTPSGGGDNSTPPTLTTKTTPNADEENTSSLGENTSAGDLVEENITSTVGENTSTGIFIGTTNIPVVANTSTGGGSSLTSNIPVVANTSTGGGSLYHRCNQLDVNNNAGSDLVVAKEEERSASTVQQSSNGKRKGLTMKSNVHLLQEELEENKDKRKQHKPSIELHYHNGMKSPQLVSSKWTKRSQRLSSSKNGNFVHATKKQKQHYPYKDFMPRPSSFMNVDPPTRFVHHQNSFVINQIEKFQKIVEYASHQLQDETLGLQEEPSVIKHKKKKDGTTTDPTSNYASGITFDPSVWFCEISEPHRHQEELRAPITITDL